MRIGILTYCIIAHYYGCMVCFCNLSVRLTFMICSITPRKLEIEEILSAIFFIKTALWLLSCILAVVHLYEFQINNFSKHFSVDSIKFEFAGKGKFNFNDFLWQAIFEIFQIWNKICESRGNISLRFFFWNVCKQ